MTLSKLFIIELVLLILTKLVLEYGYISFVHPLFEYSGFKYDLSIDKYIFGWFVYLCGYGLLYIKKKLYIFEIYLFLFLTYVLPNIAFYSLANQDTYHFMALILPYYLMVLMTTDKKFFSLPSIPNGKVIALILSLVIVLAVIMNYFITTGGKMVLSFSDVYKFRNEFGVDSSSGVFGYINSWASKIFAVVLFAWSIYKKKLFAILFSLAIILLLFALSGHKGVLQSIFLVLFFYLLFKFKNRRVLIISAFLFLISIVIILSYYFDLMMLGSLILRRLLFVPAHLNFTYLEFFTQNDFIYWSNSILKYFIVYPYDMSFVNIIGKYLGKPDTAANTGFLASGFAQAGFIGILIYTLAAIFILNLINQLSKKNEKYFVMAITFIPIFTMFVSSDFLTTLLTHGLLISVLVLWLYDNKKYTIKIGRFQYEV